MYFCAISFGSSTKMPNCQRRDARGRIETGRGHVVRQRAWGSSGLEASLSRRPLFDRRPARRGCLARVQARTFMCPVRKLTTTSLRKIVSISRSTTRHALTASPSVAMSSAKANWNGTVMHETHTSSMRKAFQT